MIHQRVSHGEAACYGHDPDTGALTGRRNQPKRYRIKKSHTVFLVLSAALAAVSLHYLRQSAPGADAQRWFGLFALSLIAFFFKFLSEVKPFRGKKKRKRH